MTPNETLTDPDGKVQEFLTSRSRTQSAQACLRLRYLGHECLVSPTSEATGLELVKVAVPLACGTSVHAGLAAALRGATEEEAVNVATLGYEQQTKDRGLEIDLLESQSYTWNEQRALTEALVRMAVRRVIPQILQTYQPLEIEQLDRRTLYQDPQNRMLIRWRSIMDALMVKKDDGELYILSWKTCAQLPMEDDARVDMQGVSEAWAVQERLEKIWLELNALDCRLFDLGDPLEAALAKFPTCPQIRGVQMCFLVKGQRRSAGKDALSAEFSPEQILAGAKLYKTASPLIYGYMDAKAAASGRFPVPMSWTVDYHCEIGRPHPMRKSSYYPTGECPGDGRHHVRSDWTSFPAWKQPGGVKGWIELLDSGKVDPAAGDPLESQWALPVPNFRTPQQLQSWFRQTRSREQKIAEAVQRIRPIERDLLFDPTNPALRETYQEILDEDWPQTVSICSHYFGRKCGMWEICHGPSHIQQDPLGSGIYQIKTPYHPSQPEDANVADEG